MSSGTAILGAGLFAKQAHLPGLAALGGDAPPLKAIYSRSEKSAQDLALATTESLKTTPDVYHDGDSSKNLDALLARSDITSVIVVLPITRQPSIILKALAAGKHVLSEKPVAPSVKEGLELIKTYVEQYKSKGLIWRVAENFEAEPAFRAAGKAIRDGRIGKVNFFRSVVFNHIDEENNQWYKTPWRTVPDYQGGFLLDGGVHTVAALRVMLPSRITELSSFASLNKKTLPPHDTIHVIARSGSQLHGTLEMTVASPTDKRPASEAFLITGTDGWLTVNPVEGGKLAMKIVSKKDANGDEKEEVLEEAASGVKGELAAFFGKINGDAGVLEIGEPLEALRDVAFIEAALNSDGKLVDLEALVPASSA